MIAALHQIVKRHGAARRDLIVLGEPSRGGRGKRKRQKGFLRRDQGYFDFTSGQLAFALTSAPATSLLNAAAIFSSRLT